MGRGWGGVLPKSGIVFTSMVSVDYECWGGGGTETLRILEKERLEKYIGARSGIKYLSRNEALQLTQPSISIYTPKTNLATNIGILFKAENMYHTCK